ncbi:MAG: permease [Planctomycetaceae bacterium]|nr:permease [Planctomycetaceae bacterium]
MRVLLTILLDCWSVLCELAPWFLLGAFVAGLIHGLAPVAFIKKRLQGYAGVLWAALFGIPLPLCSCAVIPTGIGLRKSGASQGSSISFLVATPQTGVDSVLVTAALLGWPLAIFKVVVALILGSVAGVVIEYLERSRTKRTPKSSNSASGSLLSLPVLQPAPTPEPEPAIAKGGFAGSLQYLVVSCKQAIEIIRSIYVWILIGVLLSAVIKSCFPMGAIQEWLGPERSWLQIPVSLLISLPLYVCATASVSVAAALVHGGLSVGATIVFLVAGPATNLATMGAIYRSFDRTAFLTYMVTVILGSILAAYAFDWFIAGNNLGPWQTEVHGSHEHQHQHDAAHWLSQSSAILLLVMFVYFAGQKLWGSRKNDPSSCH